MAASIGGIKQASKFLLPLKTRCPRSLPLLLLAGQSYLMQVCCCLPCIMCCMLEVQQQQQEGRSLNTPCLQQALHKLFPSLLTIRTIPAGRPCACCSRPHWPRRCLQGQWELALHELFQAYHLAKEEPLVLLCLGVALLQKSMSRKAEDRNRTILQAFAFMQVGPATRMHSGNGCAAFSELGATLLIASTLLMCCACCWINLFQGVTAASYVRQLHACLHGLSSGALTS